MKNIYEKPVISVDANLTEGVYAASGAVSTGTLHVNYYGVWDRWGNNGGKGLAMADWSDINGTITLTLNFNMEIQDLETDDASVGKSFSGSTATLTFASSASNPLTIGIHIEKEGSSIDNLALTGYSYTVS